MNNCFPLWNVKVADILLTSLVEKRKRGVRGKEKKKSLPVSGLPLSVLVRSGCDKCEASGNWTGRIEALARHTCPPPLSQANKESKARHFTLGFTAFKSISGIIVSYLCRCSSRWSHCCWICVIFFMKMLESFSSLAQSRHSLWSYVVPDSVVSSGGTLLNKYMAVQRGFIIQPKHPGV